MIAIGIRHLKNRLSFYFRFRTRRLDMKNPAEEFLAVQSGYRSERLLFIRHLDKTKPSGPRRLFIFTHHDRHGGDIPETGKEFFYLCLGSLKQQITHKNIHASLLFYLFVEDFFAFQTYDYSFSGFIYNRKHRY